MNGWKLEKCANFYVFERVTKNFQIPSLQTESDRPRGTGKSVGFNVNLRRFMYGLNKDSLGTFRLYSALWLGHLIIRKLKLIIQKAPIPDLLSRKDLWRKNCEGLDAKSIHPCTLLNEFS
jgi:hypothetical protein